MTNYGSATLNEKGMVPKDKGVGDVKPWFMGEKPMCFHLVVFPLLLFVTLFVSPNLVNLFNAQLVVEKIRLSG